MFPVRHASGFLLAGPARLAPPGAGSGGGNRGALLRLAPVALALLLGLPGGASAQALGTMQVTARVLPAEAGWTALAEARVLARAILDSPRGGPTTRRSGLVQTQGAVASVNGRRRLLLTVHHLRN